jgi:hypothetical protein
MQELAIFAQTEDFVSYPSDDAWFNKQLNISKPELVSTDAVNNQVLAKKEPWKIMHVFLSQFCNLDSNFKTFSGAAVWCRSRDESSKGRCSHFASSSQQESICQHLGRKGNLFFALKLSKENFYLAICIFNRITLTLIQLFQPTEVAKRQLFVVQSAAQPAQQMLEQVAAPSAEQVSSQVRKIPLFFVQSAI